MTTHSNNDPSLQRLQQLHQQALASISTETLAQLRQARQRVTAAPSRTGWSQRGWWLATACSAVLVVTAALNFSTLTRPNASPGVEQSPMTVHTDDEAALLLDESPELFLWLGSENTLAME